MNETYQKMARPPEWALRTINAGRLKGKSDINPQWRYQAMTEQFGPCGLGWKFKIARKWLEPGPDGQVFAFADVLVYVKIDGEWSAPIPGTGGNMLVEKETKGLHANDEAFKMAVTDALSTALKMLGVAAEIYAGNWDGSRYVRPINGEPVPLGVTAAGLNRLKKAWFTKYQAELEGVDREGLQTSFAAWVKNRLGDSFNLGGPLQVADPTSWTIEDFEACSEALGLK